MKVISIVGVAGFVTTPETEQHVGRYLKTFDVEANDGMGELATTADLGEAMKFTTLREAVELYRSVSNAHPVRLTDGLPNRPLTAYHIAIDEVLL